MDSVVVQIEQFQVLGAGKGVSGGKIVDQILRKIEPFQRRALAENHVEVLQIAVWKGEQAEAAVLGDGDF